MGQGLGNSRQKHLFLPEPQNDFIFSIVCEELGFVGACAVVLLFVLLLWRGITIAAHAPDRFGALLVVGKQVMSGLPNIEPVTLLIVLFTLELPRETPAAITVFLLLQGVLYGFGLWWAMYIYVWYLLALLTWLLRRMDNALGWAVFSGIYGLCFGGLCAGVYLVAKTPAFALSWWISGLPYDAMHGAGNFVLMLLAYHPLRHALQIAKRQIGL